MRTTKLTALALAVTMVLSIVAPGAVMGQAAAGNTSVDVETEPATNVTATSATLTGNLTTLTGADNASVYFLYWAAGSDDPSATDTLVVEATGPFSIDIAALDPNTTYVVEAYAEANGSIDTGGEVTFTTAQTDELTVETRPVTNVTNTTATLNGNLTDLGSAENATVRFHYWIEGDHSTLRVTDWQEFESPDRFSADVDDLETDTTYVVRAHAEANGSDAAGDRETFTTDADEPAPLGVETRSATDVSDDSATLNGELTGLGGADNATVWFEYWVDGDAANTTNTAKTTLDAPDEFEASIDGLDNDTAYEYVAHARADGTTVSGDVETFTTDDETDNETPRNFGLQVADFIHGLLDGGIDDDETFGQLVSQFVLANNPGADNRPDHAGPPWLDDDDGDEGNESDDDAADDRGPPEHAGPPDHAGPKDDEDDQDDDAEDEEDEQEDDEEDDNDAEDEEDDEDDDEDDDRGPPEHAGPPDDDDDEDDDA